MLNHHPDFFLNREGLAVHTLGKSFPFLSCDIIYYHKYGFVLYAFFFQTVVLDQLLKKKL
jgi:hypothetical protein